MTIYYVIIGSLFYMCIGLLVVYQYTKTEHYFDAKNNYKRNPKEHFSETWNVCVVFWFWPLFVLFNGPSFIINLLK